MTESPERLQAIAVRLAARPAAADLQRARLHLLDWLACVAGARQSDVAAAIAVEPDPLLRAAFLGNVLEMDDIHRMAILHPGPVVWPAALMFRGDMDAVLAAGVRGYEAMVAVGATFDAHHYAHFHNSATAGMFGAAAAAASMLGLDTPATVAALGNAGSVAGGLWHMRHVPVMTKQFHIAHATRTGVWAARLAASGLTGPACVLEGAQGLYAATTRSPRPLVTGGVWRLHEVSFKPWGACRHAHPAIDAALGIGAALREGPILVETYADALKFCDRPEPRNVQEAKFSLQHTVAVVAVRGAPALEDFEPYSIADRSIAAARKRVEVREAADLTAAYPAHYGARISAGGVSVQRRDTLGDPERPLDEAGVLAKARALLAWGGISADDAAQATRLVLDGDDPAPLCAMIGRWLS